MASKKLWRIFSIALVAVVLTVLLAVSSFAYSLKADGTVDGLASDGTVYEYAPATINNAGDGFAYGTWATLTSDTVLTEGGLYAVRSKAPGAEDFSDPSDAFYVYGDFLARKSLNYSIFDENNKAIDMYFESKTGFGTAGYWSGYSTHWHDRATEFYTGNGYIEGSKLSDLLNAADEQAKAAAELAIEQTVQNRPLRYAYASDEIIPISEVSSFYYENGAQMMGFTYSGTVTSRFVAYVAQLDGTISQHSYMTDPISLEAYKYKGKHTIDFKNESKWSKPFPETGYLVGFAIYEWEDIDASLITVTTADNSRPRLKADVSKYSISAPALTGISYENDVFSGFNAEDLEAGKYQYANYFINSDGSGLKLGTWSTYTADTAISGLVTFRKLMDDGTTYSGASKLFYVYGDHSARALLGQDTSAKQLIFKQGVTTFLEGYWTSKTEYIRGNYELFDGSGWVPATMLREAYLEEAAYDILKALNENDTEAAAAALAVFKSDYDTLLAANTANAVAATTEYLERMLEFYDTYSVKTTATDEEVLAAKTAYETRMNPYLADIVKRPILYAYDASNVIPVSEITNIKFDFRRRYTTFDYADPFSVAVEVFIADENGKVTTYKYVTEKANRVNSVTDAIFNATIPFSTSQASWSPKLPDNGYVVGIKLYPWYGITDIEKIDVRIFPKDSTNPFLNSTPRVKLVEYNITKRTYPPLSGIELNGTTFTGFNAEDLAAGKYQYAEYGLNETGNAIDVIEWKTYTSETELLGLVAFRKHVEDDSYSLPTQIFYVEGDVEAKATLGQVMDDKYGLPTLLSHYSGNGKVVAYPWTEEYPTCCTTIDNFVPGAWTGPATYWYYEKDAAANNRSYSATSKFYRFLDQGLFSSDNLRTAWLYMNTPNSALEAVNADDIATDPDQGGNAYDETNKDKDVIITIINDFYDDYFVSQDGVFTTDANGNNVFIEGKETVFNVNKAEHISTIEGIAENVNIKYALRASEIIDVKYLKSLALALKRNNGQVNFDAQAVVTLYVYNEESGVKPITLKSDKFSVINNNDFKEVIEFGDTLENVEGYLVGIKINGFGDIDAETINPQPYHLTDMRAGLQFLATHLFSGYHFEEYEFFVASEAPELIASGSLSGYEIIIDNAVEGGSYAYSTDGVTWTTLPEGQTSFSLSEDTTNCYVKQIKGGDWLESAITELDFTEMTFKPVPELVLGDNNVLTADEGLYEIAHYVFGTGFEYAPLTTLELTDGIWAVRAVADETAAASAPQIIYVRGAEAGTMNLKAAYKADSVFVEGAWSNNWGAMYGTNTNGVVDWNNLKNDLHFGAANTYTKAEREAKVIRYQFTQSEIIPLSEMTDIYFTDNNTFNHGYIKEGYTVDSPIETDENNQITFSPRAKAEYGKTKARVYVVGGEADYYDVYTNVQYPYFSFEIATQLANKPGYITAIELYPFWEVYGPDNKTDLGDNCITSCWTLSSDKVTYVWAPGYTFRLLFPNQFVENEVPERYDYPTINGQKWNHVNYVYGVYTDGVTNRFAIELKSAQESEVPVLSLSRSTITITNYKSIYKYVYSTDAGNTWTAVSGNKIMVSKPNTDYLVKVAKSVAYEESAPATIKSHPLAITGASLVLEGRIGIKVYVDIEESLVDLDTLRYVTSKVNSDYTAADGALYKTTETVTLASADASWMNKIEYDEENDIYFVIMYLPVKDIDNVNFENQWIVNVDGAEVVMASIPTLAIQNYIDSAKLLAQQGDAEYADALALIEAIEDYAAYADNYFNEGTLEAYTSDAGNASFASPAKEGALNGAEFVATSILLEDNLTIRHYFKVNDIEAFEAAGYTSEIAYATKGDYIYFDIKDIAPDQIGTAQVLEINAGDTTAFSISYSVANYIQAMLDDDDANLVSVVNALYDYYVEAAAYVAE